VLVAAFAKAGTLVLTLDSSIVTTQRTPMNVKAMPNFRETLISFFGVCGYNILNKFNEGKSVFADVFYQPNFPANDLPGAQVTRWIA